MFIICGIIIPILFVIYNIVYYFKKKVIYTIKNKNFIIVNNTFFKIQLGLSCVNSVLMAVILYVWNKFDFKLGGLVFILTFWSINYLIKFISLLKKYAKIEN
ncbi:hypothetical protein BGI42_15430 (plasmid) [Clostridium taeniosporum]|uniref:DUF3784 domain-containing protein n=1 Tax=Clostridium taeniosporum TaxID=394958 RepID=A0A1D7XP68_9CLOT|nr:hypothetical protein BGI42_15430 [Clostridium taeniosporum]